MKKLFSDSIIYLGTGFLSKAISFLLIPVFTNVLYVSVEGYGQIILFSSLSMLLNPFITFGGIDLIAIHYFDKNVDHDLLIRKCNTNSLFLFLLTTGLALAVSPLLTHTFGIPIVILIVVPLSALFNHFTEELLLLLRFKGNAKKYFKVFVIKIFLDIGVTLFCLVVLKWGWYSRLAGFLVAYLFTFFIIVKLLGIKNVFLPFRKMELKGLIVKALPFVLLQFFIIGLTNMDKLIVPQIFQKEDLGLYGLAFQLGYLLPTVAAALSTMTQPMVYRLLSDYTPAAQKRLKQVIIVSFIIILISAVAIYFSIPIFYDHFISNVRYRDGAYLVKYMLIAWLFWCYGSVLTDIIKKIGSRSQIIFSYFVPFLLLSGSLYYAGHHYGLKGITMSLILSYGTILLLLGFYSHKQLSRLKKARL